MQKLVQEDQQGPNHFSLDSAFMDKVMDAINNHMGEEQVKELFHVYVQHLVDIAFGDEEFIDEATQKKEETGNTKRLSRWKASKNFRNYAEFRKFSSQHASINTIQISRVLRKLEVRVDLSSADAVKIIDTLLENTISETQTIELLGYLPEARGGISIIAIGLLHKSEQVRAKTVELLNRLMRTSQGAERLARMNSFLTRTYHRQRLALGVDLPVPNKSFETPK